MIRHSLCAALALAACSSGGSGPEPSPTPAVATVLVSPSTLTLSAGSTATLGAQARAADDAIVSGAVISWQSDNALVAAVAQNGTVTGIGAGTTTVRATSEGHTGTATILVEDSYDLDALGPPEIIEQGYIDLASIARISRFRSGIGHDYSDDAESCRSMKHYVQPRFDVDWSTVELKAPVAGTIAEIQTEQTAGMQVRIRPATLPAATVVIFHVNPDPGIVAGATVAAGDRLGTHISNVTSSDIAVWLDTPGGVRRLVSYFDVMSDAVLEDYVARGVPSREAMVIGRAERDAAPLQCTAGSFADAGTLENWVDLN